MVKDQQSLLHFPIPTILLDSKMEIVDYSQEWRELFGLTSSVKGKYFSKIFDHLPEELFIDLTYCLDGVQSRSDRGFILKPSGETQWFEWKIKTYKQASSSGVYLLLEDITQKQKNQQLLYSTQKAARIGSWQLDLRENTIFWSSMTKEIHEVPQDYTPTLETGINFYREGFSRDTITKLVEAGISNGIPWDTELQIVTQTGKNLWVRAIGEPEMLNGQCIKINGTFQDIDKRKRAELSDLKVKERLSIATDSASIGIWEYNISKDQPVWDENMFRIFRIHPKKGQNLLDALNHMVHPEDMQRVLLEFQDAIKNYSEYNSTFRLCFPDGETRWIKNQGTVLCNQQGHSYKMIGISQDITELRTTQEKLENSQKSLDEAFNNSLLGLALVNPKGHIMRMNPSFCDLLGYSEEELKGKSVAEITHPDDRETSRKHLEMVRTNKMETYQLQKRYFHKSGELVFVLLTVTAVKNPDGSFSHFLEQAQDVTAKKEAEDKLKNVLQVTTNQNESLVNFAHIVSHNLRSHATNLSMITNFLLDDKIEPEDQKQTMQMLSSATHGLHETIEHLNEVVQAKLDTSTKLKTIDLHTITYKILADMTALLNENSAQVFLEVPENTLVRGIRAYIESIVLNLITNAIKYRSPERPCSITIRAVSGRDKVTFEVQDNGLGIDLDRHRNKLFGMYKTFHQNKNAKGIGLFITKNQIESMGGSIEVASEVNQGSTFKITFLKGQ